jgi:hypothetical protein
MILHKNIEQKTEDWFKIKHGKIGGSTSKGLTVKGNTLLLEMLAARCEDFEPEPESFENSAMQRGNELEPIAIRELKSYTGIEFYDIGWIEHETIKLIGISPDGINCDSTISCEVKCPSAKKHMEYIRGGVIPLEYIHQCIHYFTVIDTLKTLHFASFRPENKIRPLFVKTITRESLVNVGTKAKPVEKPVSECVIMFEHAAKTMESDLLTELENLKF